MVSNPLCITSCGGLDQLLSAHSKTCRRPTTPSAKLVGRQVRRLPPTLRARRAQRGLAAIPSQRERRPASPMLFVLNSIDVTDLLTCQSEPNTSQGQMRRFERGHRGQKSVFRRGHRGLRGKSERGEFECNGIDEGDKQGNCTFKPSAIEAAPLGPMLLSPMFKSFRVVFSC